MLKSSLFIPSPVEMVFIFLLLSEKVKESAPFCLVENDAEQHANMNEEVKMTSWESSKIEDGAERLNSEVPPSDSFPAESSEHFTSGEKEEQNATCVPHGYVSVIGRRRVMEDTLTVAPGELAALLYGFYAVYDGHGGNQVAHTCRERLHKLLAAEVENGKDEDGGINWESVMAASFSKMDEEINVEANGMADVSASSLLRSMGSTAAVVVVGVDKLVVANCGDSRAVLCRSGAAVPLSRDHKPDRPDERARIESAGGNVINWDGYRVLGVLSISRSIGDHFLRPYVISEPEVSVWERNEADEFLVIASDGLWDVVTNELACKLVKRCFSGKIRRRFSEGITSESCAMEAASILTELAMARGSKDNISVIVVQLKNHQCLGSPKKPNINPTPLDRPFP